MPHDVSSDDVQHLGQLSDPDELAAQLAALAQRRAELQRGLLEVDLEIAKRLKILADHHQYKSRRFVAFAREHAKLTRTDSYDLLRIAPAADDIVATHEQATRDDPFHEWPSWRQAMRDLDDADDDEPEEPGGYWLTPKELYEELDAEFHFDHDPFPFPRPPGYDALADDVEWGWSNYVNASFRKADEGGGRGLMYVGRGAVAKTKPGGTTVLVIPTDSIVNFLLEAGAEARSLGRVRWHHTKTGKPWSSPLPCTAFILRGSPPD